MTSSAIDRHANRVSAKREVRTLKQFVQDTIIIPSGRSRGRYFDCDTQPFTHLFFDTVDASLQGTGKKYFRVATTGPTQTGKTTIALTCPILYHLFELREDVGLGIPTMDMSMKKWTKDFLPIIEASALARYLPDKGRGSKEGAYFVGAIFKNGAALEVLPAGGGDKQRASLTMRVLAATEIDGYQRRSESKEGSVLSQMEGRLQSYSVRDRHIYLECTTTVEDGPIWQEYIGGSMSSILLPCPWCNEYVTLERKDFRGWQEAKSDTEAMEKARFHCSECGKPWEEEQRVQANRKGILHHANESTTFSFRWSAVNNLLLKTEDIAAAEWKATRRVDRDNAEREMCQMWWAVPYEDPEEDQDVINLDDIAPQILYRRGEIPPWAQYVTFGMDVGYKRFHWVLVAWKKDATGHVIDYGQIGTPHESLGHEDAVRAGMTGDFPRLVSGLRIDCGLIDSNWLPDVVRPYCKGKFFPAVGVGKTNSFRKLARYYRAPDSTAKSKGGRSTRVLKIGEAWHLLRRYPDKGPPFKVIEHDVDFGKTWVHLRLATPADTPGALSFFDTTEPEGHEPFIQQLTAERQVIVKGKVTWEKVRSGNHWLDAMVLAGAAARILGVTKSDAPPEPKQVKPRPPSKEKPAPTIRQTY